MKEQEATTNYQLILVNDKDKHFERPIMYMAVVFSNELRNEGTQKKRYRGWGTWWDGQDSIVNCFSIK